MNKAILAASVVALLGSTAAQANDMNSYQEPATATAQQVINWSGFYAGGTVGGSWGEADTKLKNIDAKSITAKTTVKPESFIGGLYAGYNFALDNNIVIGVETDFLWNSDGEKGSKGYSNNLSTYHASVKQKWNGATRIRAGYALGQEKRFLPYIAGGLSYADFDIGAQTEPAKAVNSNNVSTFTESKTRTGWNIGIGLDYVPPIMGDNLIVRAEYRYTDFGTESYNTDAYKNDPAGAPTVKMKQDVDYTQNDFRLGVAYKF